MMDCGTFLDGYSDFRDGQLMLPDRVAFEAHLRECASCARYDRVVDGGVKVLRDLPEEFVIRGPGTRISVQMVLHL